MKSALLTIASIISIFVSVGILVYEKQCYCLGLYVLFLIIIRVFLNKGDIPKELQKRLKSFKE